MKDPKLTTEMLWKLADRIARGEIRGFAYIAETSDGSLEAYYEFQDPRIGFYNVSKLRDLIDMNCGHMDNRSDELEELDEIEIEIN